MDLKQTTPFFAHFREATRLKDSMLLLVYEKTENVGLRMAKARFRRETEAELYWDLGPPKLDRFSTSIIHLFLGPVFLFMIGFVVHETKEKFSH